MVSKRHAGCSDGFRRAQATCPSRCKTSQTAPPPTVGGEEKDCRRRNIPASGSRLHYGSFLSGVAGKSGPGTASLAEIIGSRDASGRVAKWAIELAPYTIYCQPGTAIKSQALADFLVDWAETQYLPPAPDSTHWRMHFDGSKMRTGLGAGVVLTSPKGNKLKYALQIHFAASNNIAEYEALIHGLWLAK